MPGDTTILPDGQHLYPLTDLPRRPWMPRPKGKAISKWTVIRWALNGMRGRKLETLMVGGVRCCCDQWARAFFRALSHPAEQPKPLSPRRQARDHAAAEAELDAAGIGASNFRRAS